MRVPNHMSPLNRASTTQRHLSELQSEIARVSEAAVTGIEVRSPSDAPGQWHGLLDLQAGVDDQPLYRANATTAMSILSTVDSALGEATDGMDRAREIAVQMSSETYSDADRDLAAIEVDALRNQLIEVGNTQFGNRYVFAGTAYDQAPFDAAGVYTGSADVPQTTAGRDLALQTGYDGAAIFDAAIAALDDLATALRSGAGSAAATQATLPDLDVGQQTIISARTVAGFEYNDAEDAFAIAENLELALQSALDARIAADPIETYTRLAELQSTYQAALQVTAQSGNSSLFDFLR
jgi:flagellar hook-associated protein 3 FlgL